MLPTHYACRYTRTDPAISTYKSMKKILLVAAVLVLYVLHQDFWNWRTPYPLVFGFIPIGLFYQACFSVASALLMWMLVKFAWPGHLEREIEEEERQGGGAR
jgi:hypothetical protein